MVCIYIYIKCMDLISLPSLVSYLVPSGFSVIFTLLDLVPQPLWASYHMFGLLSCGHGLCTVILTLTASACVRTRLQDCHDKMFNRSAAASV